MDENKKDTLLRVSVFLLLAMVIGLSFVVRFESKIIQRVVDLQEYDHQQLMEMRGVVYGLEDGYMKNLCLKNGGKYKTGGELFVETMEALQKEGKTNITINVAFEDVCTVGKKTFNKRGQGFLFWVYSPVTTSDHNEDEYLI